MFPEDAYAYQHKGPPQLTHDWAVYKNEAVIPFLIERVMGKVLFTNDEHGYQKFASKILDEVDDDELVNNHREPFFY